MEVIECIFECKLCGKLEEIRYKSVDYDAGYCAKYKTCAQCYIDIHGDDWDDIPGHRG
jgi:hypothetical protein